MADTGKPDEPLVGWEEEPPSEAFNVDAFLAAARDDQAAQEDEGAPAHPTGSRSGTVSHRRNIATTAPIVLHEGDRMRVEAKATLIYRSDGTPHSVSLELERQARVRIINAWTPDAPRIRLDGDEVERLFSYIAEHRAALNELRDVDYLFMPIRGSVESIDMAGLAKLVERVTEDPLSFRPLAEMLGSGGLRALRAVANLGQFERGRTELQGLVDATSLEADLQRWFEANPWVFGTEYAKLVKVRDISAASQIDLLFQSIDGYGDIFELKRANVPVLIPASGHDHLQPSADLNAAFAQAVRYLREAADLGLYNASRRDIHLYQPRVRLVIGRSAGWDDRHVRAFRDITAEWHNIDVFTYDMVLARIDLLVATMARELRPERAVSDG